MGLRGVNRLIEGDQEGRVIAIVCKEGIDLGTRVDSIIISKLCQRQQFCPIVLPVVAIESQILFQCLVCPFCLSIHLWTIGSGEVQFENGLEVLGIGESKGAFPPFRIDIPPVG